MRAREACSRLSCVSAALGAMLTGAALTVVSPTAAAQSEPRVRAGIIEEIVVTSRRREESAQDVPVSVTAFGPEAISRIQPNTIRDLDGLAPNLFIGMNTAGPGAGAIFIRGLGYADIEKTQSPAVAIVLDGIFQGTSTGQLIDAFDIEQVEINRGPQGVLYGKNTTGGTIVVERSRPTGEFGVRTSIQLGTDNQRVFKGIANAPLIEDELALKVGGTWRQRDGFYRNINRNTKVGDIDYWSFTTSLLWNPYENFEAQLTYDRIRDQSDTPPQDPRFDGNRPHINQADLDEVMDYKVDAFSLRMELETELGTLISLTGYQDSFDDVLQDFDGANRATPAMPLVQLHTLREQTYEQYSQELRFESQLNERTLLTLGAFYFESGQGFDQNTDNVVQIPNALAPIGGTCADFSQLAPGLAIFFIPNPNPDIGDDLCQSINLIADQRAAHDVRSWAGFGSVSYLPTEDLELTFGARYVSERKKFDNQFADRTQGLVGPLVRESDSWDDWLINASANWRVTPRNLLYASYSEGFRSGGFSIRATGRSTCPNCDPNAPQVIETSPQGVPVVGTPFTFEPEDVWSAEIGSKNDFFDNRLRLNVAAFFTRLKGAQFSTVHTTPGIIPGTNTLINNRGTTEIRGLELEATAMLTENFSLIFTGGLQDPEHKSFEIDGTRLPISVDAAGTPTGEAGAPGPVTVASEQIGRSPDWNWSLSGVYGQAIGRGYLTGNLTVRGQDDFILTGGLSVEGQPPGVVVAESGYTLVDASISYEWTTAGGNNFRVTALGKNLFDKTYREQALTLGTVDSGFQGWGPPRTAAVELQMEF